MALCDTTTQTEAHQKLRLLNPIYKSLIPWFPSYAIISVLINITVIKTADTPSAVAALH